MTRLQVFKSKIHRATVTESNLDYDGSVTIDRELMDLAGIIPYEQVHIWNVTNGSRLVTYALSGARGSREICVNGAGAHLNEPGDLVIIATFTEMEADVARGYEPIVVRVDADNEPLNNLELINERIATLVHEESNRSEVEIRREIQKLEAQATDIIRRRGETKLAPLRENFRKSVQTAVDLLGHPRGPCWECDKRIPREELVIKPFMNGAGELTWAPFHVECLKRSGLTEEKQPLPTYHDLLDHLCRELSIPGSPTFWDAVASVKKRLGV